MPIDPELAWEFDPEAVPTVASLLGQLNAGKGEDWAATDMAGAVQTFRACFLDALQVGPALLLPCLRPGLGGQAGGLVACF